MMVNIEHQDAPITRALHLKYRGNYRPIATEIVIFEAPTPRQNLRYRLKDVSKYNPRRNFN